MKPRRLLLPATFAAILVAGIAVWRAGSRSPAPEAPSLPPIIQPAGPGEIVTQTRAPAEIFRRAFWRQPTPADRIVHADRREWSPTEATHEVRRWQWFLQVEPSPALLASLRDPATFGLQPADAATFAVDADPTPDWFPAPAQLADCEILQAPAGGLTLYYRPADNTLFATDAGAGFASAVAVR